MEEIMDISAPASVPEPMKFTVVVKTFFGGFKPIEKQEFTDLTETVNYATQHSNGKNHVLITTYEEGKRDMEFLLLFQKTTQEFMIRTNGKYIDNKPANEVFSVIQDRLNTLLKPLPELIILSKEEMEQRWAEHEKAEDATVPDDKTPEPQADQ